MENRIESITNAYEAIIKNQPREYYGLRDYYSLIKMLYGFSKQSEGQLTGPQLRHAVLRNFSGLEDARKIEEYIHVMMERLPDGEDPGNSPLDLVRLSLHGVKGLDLETRYLLLLTENYSALNILQQRGKWIKKN
jgi:hypothetical protein